MAENSTTEKALNLYDRGFLVSSRDFEVVPENFRYVPTELEELKVWVERKTMFGQSHCSGYSVLVFGFLLDTVDPDLSVQEIIDLLCAELLKSRDAFFEVLNRIGGRYAVLVNTPEGGFFVGDAGGVRSIFYRFLGKDIVCGSHSRLVADTTSASIIEIADKIQSFGSGYRTRNWPGRWSKYKEVYTLTPNTLLDLTEQRPRRFFTLKPLPELSTDEAYDRLATYLRNATSSFRKNYLSEAERELVLFLTGGIDSRLVLAAFTGIKGSITAFSYDVGTAHAEDISLAKLIAQDLSIPHKVDDGENIANTDLVETAMQNASNPYMGSKSVLNFCASNFGGYSFSLRGNLGEISRGVFSARLAFLDKPILFMARVWHRGSENHPVIFEAFKDYAEAVEIEKSAWPIRITYYWEHKHATWHAATINELDTSFDTLNILNSRNIIEVMCSVSLEEQKACVVHGKTIRRLNPKLLDYPLKYKGF